jgi:hypothetical protein
MDFGDGNKMGEFWRGSAINRQAIKDGEKERRTIQDKPDSFDEANDEGIENDARVIHLFHAFILKR